MKLELFFWVIISKCLGCTLRYVDQIEFTDAKTCALKHPDLILADRQNIKSAITAEKTKERLEVKAVSYYN